MAPDRLKLLKPSSATRETARHVRNWKATDVDNVSGIKAGAGYRERIRIREKCKGGKQAPPPPFLFSMQIFPEEGSETESGTRYFQNFLSISKRFQFFFLF